jgi:outer membrane lipoprotein carrier protein
MTISEILVRILLGTLPSPSKAPTQPAIVPSIPLVAAPGATAQDPNVVVDNVQKFYSKVAQVTASFRQAVTNDTFGSTKTSDGTVWIMKPGKMRWDYLEKKAQKTQVKKSFISNGSNLYLVEHDNMQVVKKNLQQDLMPVAVSFLYGKGDLKTEFNAALDTSNKYGAKDEVVIKLTPKKPSAQYKNLILVVNPTDFRVTQSVIIDSSNNINHFRFYSPNFEKPIDAKWFEFDEKSVKNYRVVDADSQAGAGSGSAVAPKTAPAPKK